MRTSIAFAVACALGCSGASFDVAGQDRNDTGVADDTIATGDSSPETGGETGLADAAIDTTPISDTGLFVDSPGPPTEVGGGDASCPSLPAGATEIFVDRRYTGPSTGAFGCPFTSILDAMKVPGPWSGTRTVHVAGSTPALLYNETASVFVSKNMVLLGEGPEKTAISAPSSAGAAVVVDGGAAVDGFTITSTVGDGVLTQNMLPAPIVRNVKANGCKLNGINVSGSAEVGPFVHADKNGNFGLYSRGEGTVHILAPGTTFDGNVASGLSFDGGATLKLDGGSASNNGGNGVRLNGSNGGAAVKHDIAALSASGNKGQGVGVFKGHSLKLRASTTLTNYSGVLFFYLGTNTLDLGGDGDKGGNVFGGETVANRNIRAGLLLCGTRGTGTQAAAGDFFASCAPTQTAVTLCDVAGAYADVVYSAATGTPGDPVTASSCNTGP